MPGEEYTTAELMNMNSAEFAAAKARGFRRPPAEPADATGEPVGTSVPQRPADRYAVTAWGQTEYDFETPSGQLCRLKKLPIEDFAKAGILDRVSRLPGLAEELVQSAEGAPPAPQMPQRDQIEAVVELCNVLLPLVVAAPHITPMPEEGEERVPGRIYPDSVDIFDRVAIMERVLKGVKSLDRFRNAGSAGPSVVTREVSGISAI